MEVGSEAADELEPSSLNVLWFLDHDTRTLVVCWRHRDRVSPNHQTYTSLYPESCALLKPIFGSRSDSTAGKYNAQVSLVVYSYITSFNDTFTQD